MPLDAVIARVREAIPDLLVLYCFGSRAQGLAGPESDLDLALLAPHPLDPAARWELQEALASLVRRDVDLVDLRAASTVLRKEVVATGQVLWEASAGVRGHFEAHVLSAYARLNEERAGILEDAIHRGTIHG